MGIIIIAVSILLSLFWIPGIWLAVRCTLGSEEPGKSMTLLVAFVLGEAFAALILPFALNRGGSLYQIDLLFNAGAILAALSVVLGGGVWIYSWIRKRPMFSDLPASLFLKTAFVPVFYFGISDKVAVFFNVKWSF